MNILIREDEYRVLKTIIKREVKKIKKEDLRMKILEKKIKGQEAEC